MSAFIQQSENLPDQEIYYSVLAELGEAVEKDYSPARHHVKIESASKEYIDSLIENNYLETRKNEGIELVTLPQEDHEMAAKIFNYTDENYRSLEEFREKYDFRDVAYLRDITLDYLV